MSTGAAKLVQMINQIARFFDSQPGDPAAQTLQHLKNYWAPSMLRDLVELAHDAGEGLSPTARSAASRLEAALCAPTIPDINVQDTAAPDR